MPTVAEHLEYNRKELLDLSTRNRLLSIPKASKSARLVHVVDERSDQIYKILLEKKRAMTFLPGRKSGELALGEESEAHVPLPTEPPDDDDGGVAKRHLDSKLQTALTPEGLQRRLLALEVDARTVMEEQGINILFLSLGQLEWIEDVGEKQSRFAPLLLIPVTLARGSAAEKFKLKWSEQDIEENLSLSEKLNSDFGLELPEFGDLEDFDPSKYFEAVAKAVKSRAGWKVHPDEMTLGFFSFAKLMMFRDLDPKNWPDAAKIDQHNLVSRLLVDGFDRADPLFEDNPDLDLLIPVDRLDQVVDADGSQTAVIETVRQGRNLVVQGPPGTGKSQTIVNVLAAAVLDGKRVLFVSEKLAALDVVKRRLTSRGLGDLCLELHSNKANKKTVLEELKRTWDLGRPVAKDQARAFAQLDELRTKLNTHCTILHQHIEPCGHSPFRILGELSRLRAFGEAATPLSFTNGHLWTRDQATYIRRIAEEVAERVSVIGPPGSHPWRGTRRKHFLRIDTEPIAKAIADVQEDSETLVGAIDELASYLSQSAPDSLATTANLIVLADHVSNAPEIDKTSICNSIWNAGLDGLHQLVAQGQRFDELVKSQTGVVADTAWKADLTEARKVIAERGKSLFRLLSGKYRRSFREFTMLLVGPPPPAYDDRVALLDKIIDAQTLRCKILSQTDAGKSAFGRFWLEAESNWAQLSAILGWVDAHSSSGLGASFRKTFSIVPENARATFLTGKVRASIAAKRSTIVVLFEHLDLALDEAFRAQDLEGVLFSELQSRLDCWRDSMDRLSARRF